MLSYRQARAQIERRSFTPAYLFYGEEDYLRRELQLLLQRAFLGEEAAYGCEKVDGGAVSLAEALQRLEGGNLFAARRLLVVQNPPYLAPPRRQDEAEAGGEEKSATQAASSLYRRDDDPALLERFIHREGARGTPESIILFQAPAVDRRKKLFKLLDSRGTVVECPPLKREDLARWIRQRAAREGKKIESVALEQLLWSNDTGLWFIANELDKYIAYLGDDEDTITAEVVERLYAGDPQGNVFKLADALAEGNLPRALRLLRLLLERREKPVPIFFMLVRHFRLLLAAHPLREQRVPPAVAASALQVPPFAAGRLLEQARLYDYATLEEILLALQEMDRGIKTGRLEPSSALELALARIHHLSRAAGRAT